MPVNKTAFVVGALGGASIAVAASAPAQAATCWAGLGEVRPVAERVADLVWSRVDVLEGAVIVISMSMRARRRRGGG